MVVVTPHPDDELWLAGTIATAVRAGSRVRLVCLTRGEAGTDYLPREGGRLVGEALAAWRQGELGASAALLGVAAVEVWGLPDGRLAEVPEVEVVPRLVTIMRGVGLVLGLGVDGIYGHRDHVTATRWIRRALAALGPDAPPAYGVVFAPGLFDATWASFARRRPELAARDWIGSGRGTPRGAEALVVPIGPEIEAVKRAAIRAHGSQLRGPDETAFFVPGTFVHLLGEERFERLDRLG
ncbi:MAG: PIG-L family deacetylase [Deltaproteobacteria bacterium]|nr:PIG-L family deacetylase [Deltaproteobacteria bacterium]